VGTTLTATLVADGSSDYSALQPLITMLLDEIVPGPYRLESANSLREGHALKDRLPQAISLFPCDLLLVHRDAEALAFDQREDEIRQALESAGIATPHVCVVPVRMTEAWLLVDERAIRAAVGNPGGRALLGLPASHQIESVQAKDKLLKALQAAGELGANRRRRFKPEQYRHRVAEEMPDLHALRQLPSFQRFEAALRERLKGWL
jgi:hypothetical protein